ncbi:hypothetical protein [Risungbinella massiliensis]|uniref:hypothetical protein n=1 Tax=Risungbinella massiliensis TaxID=1329796 RepID=UPI0005CBB8BD|nr:hypothetical protein [Risungbinella massiliensis]
MLEKLDQIDWSSLVHSYGYATDVPDLLQGITSLDPNVRKNVWRMLYSSILYEEAVYEAAARAVPFLIEL